MILTKQLSHICQTGSVSSP